MKKGYDPKEEKIKSSTNIIIGDMDKADIIYTAHYDTCAMLPFPNMIIPEQLHWFYLISIFHCFCIVFYYFSFIWIAIFLIIAS